MEVLVRLPNNVVWNDMIKASRGRIWLRERAGLRVDRIYGVYQGPDGLYVAYTFVAYTFNEPAEVLDIADFVAPAAEGLRPVAAKVRMFKYAICDGERFDEMIDDDCFPVYDHVEIPPRELPSDIVTKEGLRDFLVRSLSGLKEALEFGDKVLRLVSQAVLAKVPLCDESGELEVGRFSLYYCRIGDKWFVKRWHDWPYYEVPQEWINVQQWRVVKQKTHPGVEELRRVFGLEVDARQLINYVAQQLGLAEEQRYVHKPKYCIASNMELSSNRQLMAEPYGLVRVFRDYRLYFGDYDCASEPSPYGVYVVICTTLQQRECEAWRIGDIGPGEPAKVVADCIEECECNHALLEQMPEEKREEVLKVLGERLKDALERCRRFDDVKCFPLEAFSRVLGPVTTYEEAEAKWKQAVEDVEKRKEEERRKLEREREKRRHEILTKLKGLPVKIEDKGDLIHVSFAKRLPEDKFKRLVEELKQLGFKFDGKKKVWYIIL